MFAGLGLGPFCGEDGEVDKSQLMLSVTEEVPYIKHDMLLEVLSFVVLQRNTKFTV